MDEIRRSLFRNAELETQGKTFMRKTTTILIASFLLVNTALADPGADWPQWRGPDRNGVIRDSPPILDRWPEDGPRLVWHVKDIPSGGEGAQTGHAALGIGGG